MIWIKTFEQEDGYRYLKNVEETWLQGTEKTDNGSNGETVIVIAAVATVMAKSAEMFRSFDGGLWRYSVKSAIV